MWPQLQHCLGGGDQSKNRQPNDAGCAPSSKRRPVFAATAVIFASIAVCTVRSIGVATNIILEPRVVGEIPILRDGTFDRPSPSRGANVSRNEGIVAPPQQPLPLTSPSALGKERLGDAAAAAAAAAEPNAASSSRAPELMRTAQASASDEDKGESSYRLVFSTDCSHYQRPQSYLLFYSAFRIRQPCHSITRIASGCSPEEAKAEMEWHDRHIRGPMSDKFRLHITPAFSGVRDANGKVVGQYMYFNKPFGLKHWFEHGVGTGVETATGRPRDEGAIVILLDPDHLLLRPISHNFTDSDEVVVSAKYQWEGGGRKKVVEHGSPFAQVYGFGDSWIQDVPDMVSVAGPNSPALNVTSEEAERHYPAGPPYLATARDMYSLAQKWVDFVPGVHKQYPHLMAEMYAYSIAAAHLGMPHQMIESLMVSYVMDGDHAGGEGWEFVDRIPVEDLYGVASNVLAERGDDTSIGGAPFTLPNVLHYCQSYCLGRHLFVKWIFYSDFFFRCDSPFLTEVPRDAATSLDYQEFPLYFRSENNWSALNGVRAKREAFMLFAMTSAVNGALTFFKEHGGCEAVEAEFGRLDLWDLFNRSDPGF